MAFMKIGYNHFLNGTTTFAYSKIDKDINYQKEYIFTTIYLIVSFIFLSGNPYHFVFFLTINYAFILYIFQ